MRILVAKDVEIEMLGVRHGMFVMGSENEVYSEAPPHSVKICGDFFLGKYPVTLRQWKAVMGTNPSSFPDSSDTHPSDSISWDQASEFCLRLFEISGYAVRLPSESEWEYACRAGTQSDFFFGPWGPFTDETEVPPEARNALLDFAWFDLNSCDCTHPVGLKEPNSLGFFDMIGNVWEWCADVWHSDYQGAPDDGSPWLSNAERQPRSCLRGGAWDMNAFRCRSSYRSFDHRELATNRFGFRIAMDAE